MNNNGTILTGTDLNKKYGDLEVVKGVSLSVGKGEFVCLTGKSGSGKTTLLSLLSGLEQPTSGHIELDGKDISSATEDDLALFRRDNVGFIFQSFNLIPTLSAWENVALPLFPMKMKSDERKRRATELLERSGSLSQGRWSPTRRSSLRTNRPATSIPLQRMPSWRF
jgi:putative ABC transport system ATP-binding protein